MNIEKERVIKVKYKNHRGDITTRNIIPVEVWFGSTEWHPSPGWMLKAMDTEKGLMRDFALKDFINFGVE